MIRFVVDHMELQGCLLRLKEVMQSYINIIGAIMVSVWAVVVNIILEIVDVANTAPLL